MELSSQKELKVKFLLIHSEKCAATKIYLTGQTKHKSKQIFRFQPWLGSLSPHNGSIFILKVAWITTPALSIVIWVH